MKPLRQLYLTLRIKLYKYRKHEYSHLYVNANGDIASDNIDSYLNSIIRLIQVLQH